MQSDFTKDLVYSLISPEMSVLDITGKSDCNIACSNSDRSSTLSSVNSTEGDCLVDNQVVSGCRVLTENSFNSTSSQDLLLKKQCSSVEVFLSGGGNKNDSSIS